MMFRPGTQISIMMIGHVGLSSWFLITFIGGSSSDAPLPRTFRLKALVRDMLPRLWWPRGRGAVIMVADAVPSRKKADIASE
jgi:hypothetical protein